VVTLGPEMNSVFLLNWPMARNVKTEPWGGTMNIYIVSLYILVSLVVEMCDVCVDFGDVLKELTLCVLAEVVSCCCLSTEA
jgi:hypothetical protein